jgi:hypothetical protein
MFFNLQWLSMQIPVNEARNCHAPINQSQDMPGLQMPLAEWEIRVHIHVFGSMMPSACRKKKGMSWAGSNAGQDCIRS